MQYLDENEVIEDSVYDYYSRSTGEIQLHILDIVAKIKKAPKD